MIKRVSKRHPCPVCEKPDYCGVSDSFVICMRVESDRKSKNGGYLHSTGGTPSQIDSRPVNHSYEKAAPARLHSVYTKLLKDHLVLSLQHKESLLKRGLSEERIAANLYRSTPGRYFGNAVARSLDFDGLCGVPGFYTERGDWRMVDYGAGLMIPVRDSQRRIVGIQIRRDDGDPRYMWFSSASKPEGVSSGAPIHFSAISNQSELLITEGALKADVISSRLKAGVIGLPGVSTFARAFGQNLRRVFPHLRRVMVAFDMDFQRNATVSHQLFRLIKDLRFAGLQTEILTWPEEFKGLDDYLVAA